jgi:hypothetical protein
MWRVTQLLLVWGPKCVVVLQRDELFVVVKCSTYRGYTVVMTTSSELVDVCDEYFSAAYVEMISR